MARLLTGKEVTAEINEDLMRRTEILKARGICPTLGVVRLGQRPDDLAYEKNIEKRAEKVGVTVRKHLFPEDMEETALLSELEKLNAAPEVHGILIFRPLPKQIDDLAVRCALSPEKDVDGITEGSLAGVFTGQPIGFPPCTRLVEVRRQGSGEVLERHFLARDRQLAARKAELLAALPPDCYADVDPVD